MPNGNKMWRCRHHDCNYFGCYLLSMGPHRPFLHMCPTHARRFRAAAYHEILRIYSRAQAPRSSFASGWRKAGT